MTAEGCHEETEGDREGEPVLWKQASLGWLAERAGGIWLHETVEDDYADNWRGC